MSIVCRTHRQSHAQTLIPKTISNCRLVSTRGAINRGRRASEFLERGIPDRSRFSPRTKSWNAGTDERQSGFRSREVQYSGTYERLAPHSRQDDRNQLDTVGRGRRTLNAAPRRGNTRRDEPPQQRRSFRSGDATTERPDPDEPLWSSKPKLVSDDAMQVPSPIPYTTSASQFLYGFNTVFAALKAARRKLYVLHVHETSKVFARIPPGLTKNITVKQHRYASILDRMSGARPHNGVVLEASALPCPPVVALKKVDGESRLISIVPGTQTREDRAINGDTIILPSADGSRQFPLVLLLDGILDEGNVGAILRTAAFLGVSAVGIVTSTCAPLSTVMAKASSGASEIVPIFAVPKVLDFISRCRVNGWKIWASVAENHKPGRAGGSQRQTIFSTDQVAQQTPCVREPNLLMIGGEGEGLSKHLLQKTSKLVTIRSSLKHGHSMADFGVDSLNVSVATALLAAAFLRKRPKSHQALPSE